MEEMRESYEEESDVFTVKATPPNTTVTSITYGCDSYTNMAYEHSQLQFSHIYDRENAYPALRNCDTTNRPHNTHVKV